MSTTLETLLELSFYGLIFISVVVGLMIYSNISKVKHLKGVWQVFGAPFKIPFLAQYSYLSGEREILKLIDEKGDKEAGYIRISTMFMNEIYITDKNLLKEVYVTKANQFEKPDYAYTPFNVFGENILSAPNAERWKKHHNICYAAFSSKNLEYMSKVATKSVDMLTEQKWDKQITKNGSYNLEAFDDFTDITVDTLGKAGFGVSFSIFHEEGKSEEEIQKGKALRIATDIVISRAGVIKRFFDSTWLESILMKITNTQQAIDYCSDALDALIKERSQKLLERRARMLQEETESDEDAFGDLLSMLVDANIESKELNNIELKSNALIFLLAGTETSSNTLQYVSYEISKNREVQKKMRDEVDRVLGGRSPTYSDYDRFEYVNAVVMETLRLHNIVRIVYKHACKSNVTLGGGLKIPKGTSVIPMLIGAHLSEKNWDKPTEFIPKRFLSKEDKDRHQNDFTFTPFSMASRKCIGYKFASIEICMVLARLLQNYEFELLNDEKVDPIYDSIGITHKPENLKIKVTRRIDSPIN